MGWLFTAAYIVNGICTAEVRPHATVRECFLASCHAPFDTVMACERILAQLTLSPPEANISFV